MEDMATETHGGHSNVNGHKLHGGPGHGSLWSCLCSFRPWYPHHQMKVSFWSLQKKGGPKQCKFASSLLLTSSDLLHYMENTIENRMNSTRAHRNVSKCVLLIRIAGGAQLTQLACTRVFISIIAGGT